MANENQPEQKPLKDRMKESEQYGEQVRANISGQDQEVTKSENKLKDTEKKDQDIKYQGGR